MGAGISSGQSHTETSAKMCPDLQSHTTIAFDNNGKCSSTEKGRIFLSAAKF